MAFSSSSFLWLISSIFVLQRTETQPAGTMRSNMMLDAAVMRTSSFHLLSLYRTSFSPCRRWKLHKTRTQDGASCRTLCCTTNIPTGGRRGVSPLLLLLQLVRQLQETQTGNQLKEPTAAPGPGASDVSCTFAISSCRLVISACLDACRQTGHMNRTVQFLYVSLSK